MCEVEHVKRKRKGEREIASKVKEERRGCDLLNLSEIGRRSEREEVGLVERKKGEEPGKYDGRRRRESVCERKG